MAKPNNIKNFTHEIKLICSLLQTPVMEIQNTDKKKRQLVYLVTIQESSVVFTAYAVYTKEEAQPNKVKSFTYINAESHYVEKNELWVADIKKVFADYTVTLENKYGQLVWCGTPYRSTMEEFFVDLNAPLMKSEYFTHTLESECAPLPIEVTGISIDEQSKMVKQDLDYVKSKLSAADIGFNTAK